MKRNVVAVVGSAGDISDELRRLTESLARALADAGFDLVTGGMGGVMRAVAKGHREAATATTLIHIEPGWARAWERNPHPAGVVRTELGAVRNHIVVQSADLVVGLGGGAGTLSELALAWQEGKPIAVLRSAAGWAKELADRRLDQRRGDQVVAGCDTVDEVVSWATGLRPEGAYKGRSNRSFYPLEVPALHRVHRGAPGPAHRVHLRYGMSVEYADLTRRLEQLNDAVECWNFEHGAESVSLVTFDDGWKDVIDLVPVFEKLPCLCPVLFAGENHYGDGVRPLPLQRLYQHCAERGLDPEDALAVGTATRSGLKAMTEFKQHAALDEIGVPQMLDPAWLLKPADIDSLKESGWIVATHGPHHEDLTKRGNLRQELILLAETIERRSNMPWLCWPEGRWSHAACEDARYAGFHCQFGLGSRQDESPAGLVMRKVWWPEGFGATERHYDMSRQG
ncbi:MAG: polysaccharide deacetylase family protein [Gammaproteobacteria bacterium]|nr:polysaccharide deacetylase family protein [Gammaproteobacteria bacterium]